MAILPRYQRTGIQIRQPRQLDFAASREAERLGQTISSQIDRMADFAFRAGAEQAEVRGQERVREEGALPVLEQLQTQEGPRTIADRAAYDAANRIAVVEIKSAATQEMQSLLKQADESNMSLEAFNAQMADIRDGYAASMDAVNPVAASLLEAQLNDTSVTYGSKYSDIVTRKSKAAWAASVNNKVTVAATEVVDAATIEGANRESIVAKGEALLQTQLDLGVEEQKARDLVDKTVAIALRNNALYMYDNAADLPTKQVIIDGIVEQGLPGYTYEQTRSFAKGLQSNLDTQINIERRAFEDQLNDAIEVMSLTGEVKPGFQFNEEFIDDLYPADQANALKEAWQDTQEFVTNTGSLADMSPDRISEVTTELYQSIQTSEDPAAAGRRYNEWVERVSRRNDAITKDAALFVVQSNESAANMVENVQEAISTGDINRASQSILILNDVMQSQYNLIQAPQSVRKIMPKGMAASMVEAIQGIDTDVASQVFDQLQTGLGDLAPQFIEELRAAKLRPEYVEAMYQTNPAVQKELLDISGRDIKEIKVGLETTATNDALKELNNITEDYRQAFLAGGGKAAETIFNEQFAVAEKLAYSRMKDQGLPGAEAAEAAVNIIFSEHENVVLSPNAKFIVPSSFDVNEIDRLSDRLLDDEALKKIGVVPLDSAQYPGYIDEAVSLASLASDGMWLNNGTADGLVLHYNVNGYPLPVLNEEGAQIEVKFSKMSSLVDGIFSGEIDVTDPMYGYSQLGEQLGAAARDEFPQPEIDIDPLRGGPEKPQLDTVRAVVVDGQELEIREDEPPTGGFMGAKVAEASAIPRSQSNFQSAMAQGGFSLKNKKAAEKSIKQFASDLKDDNRISSNVELVKQRKNKSNALSALIATKIKANPKSADDKAYMKYLFDWLRNDNQVDALDFNEWKNQR